MKAKAQMLIRKPAHEVFEAFVDPRITTRFWFTKGSGRLEQGKTVRWDWEMYGVSADVDVKTIEPNERIVVEWPSYDDKRTTVEWTFAGRPEGTFVRITEGEFDDPEHAVESTGGFTFVVAGLKAFLEHGIELNLVRDHAPDEILTTN